MGRGEPDFCVCGHGEGEGGSGKGEGGRGKYEGGGKYEGRGVEGCGMRNEKGQKLKN